MTDYRTTISLWETTHALLNTQKPLKMSWDGFLLALSMAWDEISSDRKLKILNQAGSSKEEEGENV